MKVRAGRFMVELTLTDEGQHWACKFGYNKILIAEIKAMQGARWDPARKCWTIAKSQRNQFALDYLAGNNPFKRYDLQLSGEPTRSLMDHQYDMYRHAITRQHSVLACEMGTGKTLVAIEAMEWAVRQWDTPDNLIWYVGPVSGVVAVRLELKKWSCKHIPEMYTYDKLVSMMKTRSGKAPQILILDESSKLKTPTSQRTQVCMAIANAMRNEHGNSLLIEMTGTPAPKTPVDWWSQCEIACPGFIREGEVGKFRNRLCRVEMSEGLAGTYPRMLGWLDDSKKCSVCCKYESDPVHYEGAGTHKYIPSVNEVEKLYERLQGLVMVKYKKDCLDLPEKIYDIIRAKPTVDMLRASKIIVNTSGKAVTALGRLRALSDGFQYQEIKIGEEVCPACEGTKVVTKMVRDESIIETPNNYAELFKESTGECEFCHGKGTVDKTERKALDVGSPKDKVFKDLLDEYDDCGRFIVWCGFTGTIDRVVNLALAEGWTVLRIDGRGYVPFDNVRNNIDSDDLLAAMDGSNPRRKDLSSEYPKLAVVAQPKAGGMGLTLTMSPIALYYSNDFSGEARMQSEDRGHRAGMDTNRGYRIVDLIHLKSDEVVLENLKKKRKLQDMTMGELTEAMT